MKSFDRIRNRGSKDRKCKFTSLVHLVNEENLKSCFKSLEAGKATGVDGVTKAVYFQNLDENIKDLASRLKSKQYRPKPARVVYIPKPGRKDEKRALFLPSIEDKIVQSNVKEILECVFEPMFLDCSFGFRPRKSCHDAIKSLHQCVTTKPINFVVEVDIKKFFNNISHEWMMRCLKERIVDPNLLLLIKRLLKAGVMESGNVLDNTKGAATGSLASPILANIFLHYVLDLWFEKVFKPKAKGYVQMVRYSDDFVVCTETQKDANDFLEQLIKRFEKFGLEVSDEKTQILKFGRKEWYLAAKQDRKASSFTFLGFAHYGAKSRNGYWVMGHKTSKSSLSRKLKEVTEYIKSVRCKVPLKEWWPILKLKLAGHINYFGISGNYRCLEQFRYRVIIIAFKWINRRSQRKSMSWKQYSRFLEFNPLPQSKISYALY